MLHPTEAFTSVFVPQGIRGREYSGQCDTVLVAIHQVVIQLLSQTCHLFPTERTRHGHKDICLEMESQVVMETVDVLEKLTPIIARHIYLDI